MHRKFLNWILISSDTISIFWAIDALKTNLQIFSKSEKKNEQKQKKKSIHKPMKHFEGKNSFDFRHNG